MSAHAIPGMVPTTEKGRRTFERIVATAGALFHAKGVTATGLADIVRESGTGKGQVYHYFADKREIVHAVIRRHVECSVRPQRERLEAMRTPEDLRSWADEAVAAHDADGPARCPLGALTVELADHDPGLRAALSEGFDAWAALLAVGIDRLQRAGRVRVDRSAAELAEVLLCAYEGGVLLSEAHASTRPLRVALDSAIDAMIVPATSSHTVDVP